MITGLMCARGLASVSMFLFGVNALWDISPKKWLSQRWWLFGLCWIAMYVLSGFWSTDLSTWREHVQVKLPFLLLPLAFGFCPRFSPFQLRIFTWFLCLTFCIAACYSLYPLAHGSSELIRSYKYAHVLPTLMYNDHIGFSTAVVASIAWFIYYLPEMPKAWQRWVLMAAVLFLSIYLHILAAKTGLIALYILIVGLIIREVIRMPKRGLLILIVVLASVGLAYRMLPTFRERIGYSYVTWRSYKNGERSGIYSDASRMISYDLGFHFIKENPFLGVGAGDVLDVMKTGYARYYPEVPEEQMLWPHNQFLTTAMAAGIPAGLLLLAWMLLPLRLVRKTKEGRYFILVWLILLVPILVDPILEVQSGVGVYLVFLLWQRKMLLDAKQETRNMPASF